MGTGRKRMLRVYATYATGIMDSEEGPKRLVGGPFSDAEEAADFAQNFVEEHRKDFVAGVYIVVSAK